MNGLKALALMGSFFLCGCVALIAAIAIVKVLYWIWCTPARSTLAELRPLWEEMSVELSSWYYGGRNDKVKEGSISRIFWDELISLAFHFQPCSPHFEGNAVFWKLEKLLIQHNTTLAAVILDYRKQVRGCGKKSRITYIQYNLARLAQMEESRGYLKPSEWETIRRLTAEEIALRLQLQLAA